MKAGIYGRKTVSDLLISLVDTFPDKGIGYVQSDGSIKFVTYKALAGQALAMIPGIRRKGLLPGDKVMIVMTRNEEIVPVLWTCFLGGLIPTILQPPVTFLENNQPARKIENVFRILEDPAIILSEELAGIFTSSAIPHERLILFQDLMTSDQGACPSETREDNIAFIQFSSGSTGDPKGIILSHKNILTNSEAICSGFDTEDSDIYVNWMPLYHDMGLLGYHIGPIFGQCNQYLIETIDFVKRPTIWPEIMDRVRCTITGCPNFGQALLSRYLKNRDESRWDLSPLKAICNGAEPISSRIMSGFLDRMALHNLRRESMLPAYGMAEATLAITFHELLTVPIIQPFNRARLQQEGIAVPVSYHEKESIELVSVGKPLHNVEIRVVDDKGRKAGDQINGHIQLRGAAITRGYYNNPSETKSLFDNGWLRTGDKGFIYEGNLYITGRVKDIIFMRGQNLYAHDLENLACSYTDIPAGKIIFGGLFDPVKGYDQVLMFLVGSPNPAIRDTFLNLRTYFRDTFGIPIDIFVPVRSNQVPKTSSGKIQRYKLISAYQNGEFKNVIDDLNRIIKGSG
jgi:acyl-CoA synthetase (AMP-forming)/AMP-acid ligase II